MQLALDTIQEARFGSIVTKEDIDAVRDKLALEPADRRFSVIVHYNELKTSQEFATALNKAHPAIAVSELCSWCSGLACVTLDTLSLFGLFVQYQMLKIVGETSSQKQSVVRAKATREEAIELATSLNRHGVMSSIVSTDYKAKIPVINSLLQWLVELANLSDSMCRLICEQVRGKSLHCWACALYSGLAYLTVMSDCLVN